MRKLTAFNFVTLNGFYKDANNSTAWHVHGEEGAKFAEDNMQPGNILLFGRITYEMMAGFWPSPMAMESMPGVAKGMNEAEKIVFSKSLKKADWQNTTVIKNMVAEVKKLKQTPGHDMTILGSGSIITQLADAGLLDGIQLMIDPVALGAGTPIFGGLSKQTNLKLTDTKTFKSGTVLLSYQLL
jgi:dihydrofolate reductase